MAEFLFDDGYGNISTVTQGGNVKCAVRYNPFGEPINPQDGQLVNGDNPCHSGATMGKAFYRGGRRDESTGRYQLGSRTYDPKTSNFLTPDSYRTGGSAQSLSVGVDPLTRNSYSYVNGDPVNLIDPDGHAAYWQCPDGDCDPYQPGQNSSPAGTYVVTKDQHNDIAMARADREAYAKAARHEATTASTVTMDRAQYQTAIDLAWESYMGGIGWDPRRMGGAQCFRWGCEQARKYFYANRNDPDVVARSIEIGLNYCIEHTSTCRKNDLIAQIGTDLLAAAYYTGGFALVGAGSLSLRRPEVTGSVEELATIERHLGSIDALSYPPNREMLNRIAGARSSGRALTIAEENFLRHELTEAELMRLGVPSKPAHKLAGKTHPTYGNYDPEVVKSHPELFNSNWRQYWGIK